MSNPDAKRYGGKYYCIKTKLSESGEIYLMADEARILPNGELLMIGRGHWDYEADPVEHVVAPDEPDRINLALAPGTWTAVFAASCMDGHAVAVEHWKGEIVE